MKYKLASLYFSHVFLQCCIRSGLAFGILNFSFVGRVKNVEEAEIQACYRLAISVYCIFFQCCVRSGLAVLVLCLL